MNLNKVFIIGNLTRDPELKALPSGVKVCSFGVATNRVWKDRNGIKKEDVDFHNIVTFARQAEVVGQYLKKGSNVMVEGRLQTRSWDAPDGQKKYRTEIIADRVQFGPKSSGGGGSGATGKDIPASDAGAKDAPPADTIDYPEEEINPDDIPF